MPTMAAITDSELIDLSVKLLGIEYRPDHDAVARTIHCLDREGNPLRCNEFENSPLPTDSIQLGRWYRIERAIGDVFHGERMLNTGVDTTLRRISRPEHDLVFTVFSDDDVGEPGWEESSWYRFSSVLGDIFRGSVGFTAITASEIYPTDAPELA